MRGVSDVPRKGEHGGVAVDQTQRLLRTVPVGSGGGGGSRSFDFGGDDVLCSYDDFAATSEPKRPDPADKVPLRSVPLFLLCSLL